MRALGLLSSLLPHACASSVHQLPAGAYTIRPSDDSRLCLVRADERRVHLAACDGVGSVWEVEPAPAPTPLPGDPAGSSVRIRCGVDGSALYLQPAAGAAPADAPIADAADSNRLALGSGRNDGAVWRLAASATRDSALYVSSSAAADVVAAFSDSGYGEQVDGGTA